MPVTTYLHDPPEGPPEYSADVASMWEDFQKATAHDYVVREREVRTERWLFRDDVEYRYDLYSHVHGPEYQIMQCVETEGELLAYMFGAINGAMNSHHA